MQRVSLLPVLALALVAGAGAGTLATVLRRPAAPAPTRLAAAPAADAEVLARLDALAAEQQALRERLAELELRPLPAPRAPVAGGISRAELDALRAEVEELRAGRDSALAPGPPPAELQAQVADALSAIRKEEAVESVRARQEKRVARLDQDVEKLGEWLELAPYQADAMREALLAQYEREAEVRRLWEEGADPEFLGQRKQEDGARFFRDVEAFLSPEQLERFRSRVGGGGK